MEKLITLQWLRGIAAVLVAWMHCIYLASSRNQASVHTDWGSIYEWGAVGVDIFFVISGFIVSLTAARSKSIATFVANRFRRIWPMYAIATFAFIALTPSLLTSPARILESLFLLTPFDPIDPMPTLGPGWTLTFEMAFYAMLVAAMSWKGTARPLPERVLLIVGILVLCGAVTEFIPPMNVLGNPLVLEFAMGVVIGWVWMNRPIAPRWVAFPLFIAGAVLLIYTAMYGFGSWFYANNAIKGSDTWERVRLWGIPSALLVAGAVLRQQPSQKSGRLLTLLGDASYSIYLVHASAILLLDRHDAWMDGLPADAMILIATTVSVGAGVAVYYLVERPLLRMLKRPKAINGVPAA